MTEERQTVIDRMPFALNIVLTVLLDPIWQGVNRIMRHKDGAVGVLIGILWILTLGLFAVGWIIDIVTMAVYKKIKLFC